MIFIKLKSKLEETRAASLRSHAFVLLKGPDTVVAAPDGRASIAANAPPTSPPPAPATSWPASSPGCWRRACRRSRPPAPAVWLHGEAATAFGPGLIAEDLPEMLPAVYRRLFEALTAPSPAETT